MTPRFQRTRKFANPYALVGVDFAFAILWLSAFAAVANWNGTGRCKGGCKLSKTVVALGVFIWYFSFPIRGLYFLTLFLLPIFFGFGTILTRNTQVVLGFHHSYVHLRLHLLPPRRLPPRCLPSTT